jgi:DNA-binding transcriptional LysR family regulator
MFDWNDLRYFLAVARHGSTIAAAKALGVNQSTVHRRLEELESRLGRRLVVRQTSGHRLTEFGQEMLSYAERVYDAVLAFERRVAASDPAAEGQVKITCPEAVGARLLNSPLLARFSERNPGIRVEFILSDKLLDLASGEAEIAIRATAPYDESLFGRKIAETAWAVYASGAYLDRAGAISGVTDLGRHSVAVYDVEQHETKAWLQSVAPEARVVARCNSMTALLSAVRSGIGVAALPMTIGEVDPQLTRVVGPLDGVKTNFYLLIHQDMKDTPRVRALFDYFVEHAPEVQRLLGDSKATG